MFLEREICKVAGPIAQLFTNWPFHVSQQLPGLESGQIAGPEIHRRPADQHHILPDESPGIIQPAPGQYCC